MNKPKKFEDCFDAIPESIIAANWATICRIMGWIILAVCLIVSCVFAFGADDGGFVIFLGCGIGGFIIAATFWVLGSILDALASSAQSNAETARMTYWQLYVNEAITQKIVQKQEKQQRKTDSKDSTYQKENMDMELLTVSEAEDTNTIWTCANCGVENDPWDSVCGCCGEKKAE